MASERASNRRSRKRRRKQRALAQASLFACHSCVTSLESLKWRACLEAVTIFIIVRDGCIVIIMAQSIPSVPIPPKAFILSSAETSFGSRHLSRSEQNCSKSRLYPNPSIQITFGRFIPNYRKKSLHFYVKKKQPSSKTDKYHCVVLTCLKCVSIFSYNVKHPVLFHDLHLRVVNNSYKNGSALRL